MSEKVSSFSDDEDDNASNELQSVSTVEKKASLVPLVAQKSLNRTNEPMPLKLKVVLGPIAKYKQFGIFEFEQPINNNLFRQIPLETCDLRSFDICHFHAGDVDD